MFADDCSITDYFCLVSGVYECVEFGKRINQSDVFRDYELIPKKSGISSFSGDRTIFRVTNGNEAHNYHASIRDNGKSSRNPEKYDAFNELFFSNYDGFYRSESSIWVGVLLDDKHDFRISTRLFFI